MEWEPHHAGSEVTSNQAKNSQDAVHTDGESQTSNQDLSTSRLVMILAGLWFGILLVALDATMIGTIAASIASTFDAFEHLAWITSTYSLGSAISQPLSGHLTDLFGRRAGLLVSYITFLIGTLLCGVSPYSRALWVFLLGRVIQGLGGGSLGAITTYVESDIIPLHKRSFMEGIANVAFGATLALGGLYGGAVDDAIGWKWAFLIQLPVILFDAILVGFVVRIPPQRPPRTHEKKDIDYIGCILILIFITLFQYAMNAGSISSWKARLVIAFFVISGVSLAFFLFWSFTKASNPVIPIKSLCERTIAASQISFFFDSAVYIIILYYVPIYTQVRGSSNFESGIKLVPLAIALSIASIITGYAIKKLARYYHVNIVIQLCAIGSTIGLCTMTSSTPYWALYIYIALYGIGFGGAFITRLMGILSTAAQEELAVIQAANWTISSIGCTVGLAAASALFQRLLRNRLDSTLQDHPDALNALKYSFKELNRLSPTLRSEVQHIYFTALRGVFYMTLGTSVLAALSSFVMKNNKLVNDDQEDQKGDQHELNPVETTTPSSMANGSTTTKLDRTPANGTTTVEDSTAANRSKPAQIRAT